VRAMAGCQPRARGGRGVVTEQVDDSGRVSPVHAGVEATSGTVLCRSNRQPRACGGRGYAMAQVGKSYVSAPHSRE